MHTRPSTYSLLLLLTVLGPGGCSSQQGPTDRLRIALIDSVWSTHPWNAMAEGMFTYRVRVIQGTQAETLSNVITPLPFIASASTIVGFLLDTGTTERLTFLYRTATHSLERFPLPADLWYFFHDVVIAPDGRHLLYLAADSLGNEWATVRQWPQGAIAFVGPRHPVCECDVDLHHARWVSTDTFQLATKVGRDLWQVLTGTASDRAFEIDTLRGDPQWH